jgi:hypothetical protein
MASKERRIVELSNIIGVNTAKIDRYLSENNLPEPTFDAEDSNSLTFPSEIQDTREEVLNASLELQELLLGAKEVIADFQVNLCGGAYTTIVLKRSTNVHIVQLLRRHSSSLPI